MRLARADFYIRRQRRKQQTVVLYLGHGLFDGCIGVVGLPLFHLDLDKDAVCSRLALGLVLLICMGGT